MNRRAYFYRVPPQELHRRSQLQPEPAKTKALQTVIEMKVGAVHICQKQLVCDSGVCSNLMVPNRHVKWMLCFSPGTLATAFILDPFAFPGAFNFWAL